MNRDQIASNTLLRLELDVPEAHADAAVAAAWRLGAQGVALRDRSTGDAPPGRVVVCSWHPPDDPDALRAAARDALGPVPDARLSLLPEDPRGWRASLGDSAVTVGGFTVHPLGADPPDDPRALHLEPGSAFGGGAHPTTALCVEAIEAAFAARAPRTVLDVGTGTGILALVAARLGAARVVGTDIDPLARHTARRHVTHHRLADRITIAEALPDDRFDLVVANLYLAPLLALAPALAERVAPRGGCVVSGISIRHREPVERAFAAHGLAPARPRARDGWLALELWRSAP